MGIRDAILAGKDWEGIAEAQKRLLGHTSLAGSRQVQALLEAFESMATEEADAAAKVVCPIPLFLSRLTTYSSSPSLLRPRDVSIAVGI